MALPWLTNQFLREHHKFFANQFLANGIFKILLPLPDIFEIKYGIKSFGGQFCVKKAFNGTKATWIRITPYTENTSKEEIISILVHEMIHQYIYEAKIHDTSSHGVCFKSIMNDINWLFKQNKCYNLGNIFVRIYCTQHALEGEGFKEHKLIIYRKDSCYYCAKINSNKYFEFNSFAIKLVNRGTFEAFSWFVSKNHKFDTYQQCNKNLTGYKIGYGRDLLKKFIEDYGLSKYTEEIEEF